MPSPLQLPKDFVAAMAEQELERAFRARPAEQQQGYLDWLAKAESPADRRKRLDAIMDELALGSVYLGAIWSGA
jgi:uncharacterized protein YdeI (YjbR/CyaY-like superfamily)